MWWQQGLARVPSPPQSATADSTPHWDGAVEAEAGEHESEPGARTNDGPERAQANVQAALADEPSQAVAGTDGQRRTQPSSPARLRTP